MHKGHPQFTEFEHLGKEAWLDQVEKELKGKEYKELFWSIEEGITLEPYYSESDKIHMLSIPSKVFQGSANAWVLRQKFWSNDLHQHLSQALQHGLEAAEVFSKSFELNAQDLDGVHLQMIELNGHAGDDLSQWEFLEEMCTKRGLSPEEISGSLTLDLSDTTGSSAERMSRLRGWRQAGSNFRHMRAIGIDAARYAEQGANAVTELAIALSKGHAALLALLEGDSIDEIAGSFEVKLTSGLSFYKDIAKLRAMRYLWMRMIEAYKPEHACSKLVWIHTETTAVNHDHTDPYVNLIRGTTAAMSAAMGGTDSLTVLPFDHLQGKNTKEGLRWARNIQHILTEESDLHQVADPAKGSWYLENLTYQIAQKAWEQFCEWEDLGGFLECEHSHIKDRVRQDREALIQKVADEQRIVLGVNRFKPTNTSHQLKVGWTALEEIIPGRLNLARELENRKTRLS